MVTDPSSSGCRSNSSTSRGNSGNSSRNSRPLCAKLTSPGRGMPCPPPISPASEMVWCGARNGRSRQQPRPLGSMPATLWILVVSMASSKRERRQDAGQALGKHGFARARRADHQYVVPARGCHFQRALGGGLAAHVAEIQHRRVRPRRARWPARTRARTPRDAPAAPTTSARCRTPYTRTPSTTAASAAFSDRQHQVRDAVVARADRHRQRARARPHGAVERKFAHKDMRSRPFTVAHGAQDTQRHRQIEPRAFFAHVGRRQVDGHRLVRIAEAGIDQRDF